MPLPRNVGSPPQVAFPGRIAAALGAIRTDLTVLYDILTDDSANLLIDDNGNFLTP